MPKVRARALGHDTNYTTTVRYLGRYSIEKLHVFHRFHAQAPRLRILLEILWAPVPLLLVILALEAVPLGDPHAGARQNVTTFLRSIVSHSILMAASLVSVKGSVGIPDAKYSTLRIAWIAGVGAVLLELTWLPFAIFWRYPVPFREFIGIPPFTILIVGLNVLLARDVITIYISKLKTVLPLFGTQLTIFYTFLGLSILFARIPIGGQLTMIATLQIIKIITKNLLWRLARRLDDVSTDVTICIVEMSGSLCQTVCLQYANRIELEAIIMILDFFQAMYEVHAHMGHTYHTDNRRTLQTTVKIIESALHPGMHEPTKTPPRQTSSSHSRRASWSANKLASLTRNNSDTFIHSGSKSPTTPPALMTFSADSTAASVFVLHNPRAVQPKSTRTTSRSRPDQSFDTLASDDGHPTASLQLRSTFAKQQRRASWSPDLFGIGHRRSSRIIIYAESGAPEATSNPHHRALPPRQSADRITPNMNDATENTRHHGPNPVTIDGLVIARRDQAHILQQSLQLLFACEVLVFVEFMEMFVPFVYDTYVGVAWYLPNARYSLVLRSMSRANMHTTVITSFISASLELISFIWLSWLMRRRYGISPLRQLAFVLKQYRGAFHGKLIACFITIVTSATVHQGMEFLF